MNPAAKFIKTIKGWAEDREDIRALILIGSHAQKGETDHLSDIDLCFFVTDTALFKESTAWLDDIAPTWLSFTEQEGGNIIIEALHEDGFLVEYIFFPISALEHMQKKLPTHFDLGFKVLLDKDKRTKGLPKASGGYSPPEPPTPEDFHQTIHRFWFNAHQVAKYIWRGELWRAKHYDWQLKGQLLRMMGWHAAQIGKQTAFTTYQGKALKKWIDPQTYTALMAAFGRFYPADSWRALDETVKLFTRLAKETAQTLDMAYPQELEDHLNAFIQDLESNPK